MLDVNFAWLIRSVFASNPPEIGANRDIADGGHAKEQSRHRYEALSIGDFQFSADLAIPMLHSVVI